MIIAVSSLKGGAGKTAVSVFLAQALADSGRRVAAVDLDHNNNLTDYFLRNVDTAKIESANVYHALTGTRSIGDCLHMPCGISVLPATPDLARVGLELARDPGAVLRFAKELRRLDFEAIIIDTPPALCFELSCALYAAHTILSPVSLSRWTVQGFSLLREEAAKVSRTTGKPARLLCLPVQVSAAQEKRLRGGDFAQFTKTTISRAAAVKSACDSGKPLPAKSISYAEFKSLAEELSC
jgi:chromosome partitioning protein